MNEKINTENRAFLMLVWIAMAVYGSINVLLAFFMKDIVDSATARNMDLFLRAVIATLFLVVFEFGMGNVSRYFLQLYCKKNLLSQKAGRYRNALYVSSADRTDIAAFSTDVELLYSQYYMNIALIACHITQLALSAAGIVYMNWKIALIVLVSTVLPFVVPMVFSGKLQASTDAYRKSSDSYLGFVQDSLNGLQEIRAYQAFPFFLKKHDRLNEMNERQRLKNRMWLSFNSTFSAFVSTLSFVAIMACCGYLTLQGQATIGVLIAVTQLMNTVVGPVAQISGEMGQIRSAKKLVRRNAVETPAGGQTFQKQISGICLADVGFSYDSQKPVFQNLDLCLERGKRYAIIGESGVGKSTLARVISGVQQGYTGAVRVLDSSGGILPVDELPYYIQYVAQEPYLFRLSAKENVYLGEEEGDGDWQHKMESLGLEELSGQDSAVLSNREGISGGQKQRLVIARALSHKTDVLILDEPTANLDKATARKVMRYILDSPCGMIIVITHDESDEILSLFDEVIRLK